MNKVITFLKKLSLLILLFCLFDFLSGIVLKKVFQMQKSGKYYTTLYGLEHAKENILIFGSSHANENINSRLMEEKLKESSFNLGNQGMGLMYDYPMLKSILKKSSPKLVIIVVGYKSLAYLPSDYEKLSVFLPLKGINPDVDSAIGTMNGAELYKSYSSLYRYNSAVGYMLMNIVKKTYAKSYESRGFDPQTGNFCKNAAAFEKARSLAPPDKDFKLDSLKINYLTNMIDELQARKIKTLFIATPLYNAPGNSESFSFVELKKLLNSKHAELWDFTNDSLFEKKCDLFNDGDHLNEKGANLFTEYIIEKLKPVLQ